MDNSIAFHLQTSSPVKKFCSQISIIPRASYKSGFPNYIIYHCILNDPKNPKGFSALKSAQAQKEIWSEFLLLRP